MDWLSENWIWVIFGVGFFAMHMFGHGGDGGHGGHGRGHGDHGGKGDAKNPDDKPAGGASPKASKDTANPHRH